MTVVALSKHDQLGWLLKSEWQKWLGGAAHTRVVFFRLAFINNSSFFWCHFSHNTFGFWTTVRQASASTDTDRVYAVMSNSKGADLRPVSLRGGTGMRPRDRNTGSKSIVERPAVPGSGTGPPSANSRLLRVLSQTGEPQCNIEPTNF